MLEVAVAIRSEVERATAAFRRCSEADMSTSRAGKWSRKEILGHLIDSAANNYQRIVRAQFTSPLVFPGYDQVAWVEAGCYRVRAWSELVDLWMALNRHFAAAVEAVPAERLGTMCVIGENEPKPLEWWIRDYLRHLKHHVDQIERG